MNEREELKPCPFCGEAPKIIKREYSDVWDVWCANDDCAVGCETSDMERGEAIKGWNVRSGAPAQPSPDPHQILDEGTRRYSEHRRARRAFIEGAEWALSLPSPSQSSWQPVAWRVTAGGNIERHLFENKRDAQEMRNELEENGWTDVVMTELVASSVPSTEGK